ncbi:MAG: hypothetical protein ACK5MR_15350 [Cumulibacter sp.]
MSIPHVLLVFVGGPVLVLLLTYLLAFLTSRDTETAKRYKLGEHWDRGTLWFVGRPKQGTSVHQSIYAIESGADSVPATTMVGGASGTW